MEILGNRRVLIVCALTMLNTMTIGSPTPDDTTTMYNETIDPCDDFYEHVCTPWRTEHPKSSSFPEDVRNKIYAEIDNLIKERLSSDDATFEKVQRKLSDYHKSCVDNGAEHYRINFDRLRKIMLDNGDWPLLFPNNESFVVNDTLNLITIHENYAEIVDNGALFDINLWYDYDENKQVKLYPEISLGKFPGGRVDQWRSTAALELALRFINPWMPRPNTTDLIKDIMELLRFELSLYAIEPTNEVSVLNMSQIQDMWQKKIPQDSPYWINWTEVIKEKFAKAGVYIPDDQNIFVESNGSLEKLGDLLNNHTLRTVVNYVHWAAIVKLAPYVSREYSGIVNAKEIQSDEMCRMSGPMKDHGASYLYVKRHLDDIEKSKPVLTSQIMEIMAELKRKLSQSWMNDDEKSRLREFIDDIVINIGYPNWYNDPSKIEEYMSDLTVGEYFLENAINYVRYSNRKQLRILLDKELLDRISTFPAKPMEPVAGWNVVHSSLMFTAGQLRKPFYNVDNPRDQSYMDFVIGHELGHAIKEYVYLANDCDNWNKTSTSNTTESCRRKQCFIDQYNSYRVATSPNTSVPMNGVATLSENIADNVGLKLAWTIYPDKQTHAKRFFYSIAKVWCQVKFHYDRSDPHPPTKIRINGIMKNMPEFSTTFGCPVGSPMNPPVKCDFWGTT